MGVLHKRLVVGRTTLGLHVAQSRSNLFTLGHKVGNICILGALGPSKGGESQGNFLGSLLKELPYPLNMEAHRGPDAGSMMLV